MGHKLKDFNLIVEERIHVLAVDPVGQEKPPLVPDLDYVIGAKDTLVVMGELPDLLKALRNA